MTGAAPRRRVLLLFGGRSAEHDVSRVTAVAVARALDPDEYEVVPVGITTDGRWLLADDAVAQLEGARDALPAAFAVDGEPVELPSDPGRAELVQLDAASTLGRRRRVPAAARPVRRGRHGAGPARAGRTCRTSARACSAPRSAMDKVMMKHMFAAAGLPHARVPRVPRRARPRRVRRRVEAELGLPVLREAREHGLVGRRDEGARPRASSTPRSSTRSSTTSGSSPRRRSPAARSRSAVLGDDPPEASLPGEVVPGADFYAYADKYEDGKAELLVPAPLDRRARPPRCARSRCAAFEACRCEAMARVDCFLRADGAFLVNELNTIPGFTPISMYPKLWEATRRAVPGAARPAHRPRDRAPRPPRPPRRQTALNTVMRLWPTRVWV